MFYKSVLAGSVALALNVAAHAYDGVVFFGDSLTDGGYFRPALTRQGMNPAAVGEFTTNPDRTWASSFATALGDVATPDIPYAGQMGNNYAIGGARAGMDIEAMGLPVTSVATQVERHIARGVQPNALHVVWVGANDLFAAAQDPASAQGIILSAVDSQVASIARLHGAGARYILVPNIPDVGLTPDFRNTALQTTGTTAAASYNNLMLSRASSTGANIIPLDTFNLLRDVNKDPTAYGITNMTAKACTGSSLMCNTSALTHPDANRTHFFADGVHPTGVGHQMISQYAQAVVTAPTQVAALPHITTQMAQARTARLHAHIDTLYDKPPARQVWATGALARSSQAGAKSDVGGSTMVGVDFTHPNSTWGGVSGIYATAERAEYEQGGLTSDISALGLGVYHASAVAGTEFSMGVGMDVLDVDTERQVQLGTRTLTHQAQSDGRRYHAHIQAGYPIMTAAVQLTPYAGATATRVRMDALTESDTTATAMHFDEQKYSAIHGKAGVKARYPINDKLALYGDVHYQKRLSDKAHDIHARLNTLPQYSFSTPSASYADDSIGATLAVSGRYGRLRTQAGVSHQQGDDTDTAIYISVGSEF